jgi:hypothetical protein
MEVLKDKILYTQDITTIRDEITQLKGQIFTLELLEDLENFLEEEAIEEDEEIQTSR